MLSLSLYVHSDKKLGVAIWRDGKLLDFQKWSPVDYGNVYHSHDAKILYFENLLNALCSDWSTRFGHDPVSLAVLENPQGGSKEYTRFLNLVRVMLRLRVNQVIDITAAPDHLDDAIRLVEAQGRVSDIYVAGAVQCGITGGLAHGTDLINPKKELTLTLNNPEYSIDPGLRETLLVGLSSFCEKTSRLEPLQRQDCSVLVQLSLLARLPGMDSETSKKLKDFGNGVLELWRALRDEQRLTHEEKRIELSDTKKLREEVEELVSRLDAVESQDTEG